MEKKYYEYITREELHLRKSAGEYRFRDKLIEKANKLIIKIEITEFLG